MRRQSWQDMGTGSGLHWRDTRAPPITSAPSLESSLTGLWTLPLCPRPPLATPRVWNTPTYPDPSLLWIFAQRTPSMRPFSDHPLLLSNCSLILKHPKHFTYLLCFLPVPIKALGYKLHTERDSCLWFSAVSSVLDQCLVHKSYHYLFNE